MQIDSALRRRLIEEMAATVEAHCQELTELDQAIGDGDHGTGMKRGFDAVLAHADKLADQPLPAALRGIGQTLVMSMGGASGPLYGTFFLELGKALDENPDRAAFAAGFARAMAAVAARGKSEPGQKTLLDVLAPVSAALAENETPAGIARVAAEAAEATVPMQALRGRAAFLGARSVGHMDPGARSASLIIGAVCAVLEGTSG
ncbi:dihydroxyacetone kinase subunit DhaL [Kaistia granuli]|uniref:dihydroxyacetone kinase subunit DhaL n=1 Tax=Kaistia granuli TaxID=363259 RepID=UPI000365F928|nr:dihydroxyacetone kinase subunit DhaL [Kaistia granuli]